MTKDLKSKINREANRLAQQLAKEIAAITINQIELNITEPIRLEVKWGDVTQMFVSEHINTEDKF